MRAGAAALLVAASSFSVDSADSFSAKQILDKTAKVYAECATYLDTGCTKTTFIPDRGQTFEVETRFSTAFVRPHRFRFEFAETGERYGKTRYVIARDEKQHVRHYWGLFREVSTDESLKDALFAAAGVTSGSSETIPALLLPDETVPYRMTGLVDLQRLDEERLGTHRCYRVEGRHGDGTLRVWIDAQSFLVRRIEGAYDLEDLRTVEMTDYDPHVNDSVPVASLAFGIADEE